MIRVSTLLVLLLTGCYQIPTKSIKDKDYSSFGFIAPRNVHALKLHDSIADVKFVVLSTEDNSRPQKLNSYVKAALIDIGFKKVISEEEYTRLVLEKSNHGSSLDLASLYRAQMDLDRFLVIKVSLINTHPRFSHKLEIIDPTKPEILVNVVKNARIMGVGIDRDILHPTMNFTNRWYEASKAGKMMKPYRRERNKHQWRY
jgi:hypothetical protein